MFKMIQRRLQSSLVNSEGAQTSQRARERTEPARWYQRGVVLFLWFQTQTQIQAGQSRWDKLSPISSTTLLPVETIRSRLHPKAKAIPWSMSAHVGEMPWNKNLTRVHWTSLLIRWLLIMRVLMTTGHHPLSKPFEGSPGDPVLENAPCNARDTGSSPGPGRSHNPTCCTVTKPVSHNWAHTLWLLKPTCLEPELHHERSHRGEKSGHHNEEQPLLSPTRACPSAATKTHHSPPKVKWINLKKKKKIYPLSRNASYPGPRWRFTYTSDHTWKILSQG